MNEPYRTILSAFAATSGLRLGRSARARSPLAPRPRSGLAGLGDALKTVEDGVNRQWQQSVREAQEERRLVEATWGSAAERFAADLDTEAGSEVLTGPLDTEDV